MKKKMQNVFHAVLEAVAVGDAMGLATEGMTQEEIRRLYPVIDGLLPMAPNSSRKDEIPGTITDDMGQNLYLIRAYLSDKRITIESSVAALQNWVNEMNGDRFMGPSSRQALAAIQSGESVYTAGRNGTSCGAVMRMPAVTLCSNLQKPEYLDDAIACACVPTHNTSLALVPAFAYAYALREALLGGSMDAIIDAAIRVAEEKQASMEYVIAGPSCAKRLAKIRAEMPSFEDDESFMEVMYGVYGTSLASIETFTTVMAIFMYCGRDVYRAIQIAVGIGGDTDSIAALAGALCAAYASGHNIPKQIINTINEVNHLDCAELAHEIVETFQR